VSILQYETQVSPEGYITLPPMPEYRDRRVAVYVDERKDEMPHLEIADKTPEQNFLDFSEELAMPALSDDNVDRMKDERHTIGQDREPLSETEEQRRAAGQKFFDTWNGLLEGMPDMTMKEIRAERLERRHGK